MPAEQAAERRASRMLACRSAIGNSARVCNEQTGGADVAITGTRFPAQRSAITGCLISELHPREPTVARAAAADIACKLVLPQTHRFFIMCASAGDSIVTGRTAVEDGASHLCQHLARSCPALFLVRVALTL